MEVYSQTLIGCLHSSCSTTACPSRETRHTVITLDLLLGPPVSDGNTDPSDNHTEKVIIGSDSGVNPYVTKALLGSYIIGSY